MVSSFKLKLVSYFVLLSLIPMAAAFWGFTSVAGTSNTRQVDARLQADLRAALADYQGRLDARLVAAEKLARVRRFQIALERRDAARVAALLPRGGAIAVVGERGFRVGAEPARAVTRSVDVVSPAGRVGTVVAWLPLDETLVASLRTRAGIGPDDRLALVENDRVVAASPRLRGVVPLEPGRIETVPVDGRRYRTLVAPPLSGTTDVTLAVLSPQAVIEAADSAARNRLLIGLLASLALLSLVAYYEGRSIVRTLADLAGAAHGIARGRLSERVPVRGRDEFALLGGAFNDMATQLEARVAELDSERRRLSDAIGLFGQALAATHDVDQLLGIVAEAAHEATRAAGARLTVDGGPTVERGDPDAPGERLELPLEAGGQTLGRLELAGYSFDDEQRATAALFASHAAVALENARLHRLVERQALVDGLTGVGNRRRCEEALQAEVARAGRLGTPLSLVLADLDDFKGVNDRHGHAAGDEVLREFAVLLRETVRESDVAGRWGGEEFVLLLPGADGEGAARLAERIRVSLSTRLIEAGDEPFHVTCSFGVAERVDEMDAEGLFAAADRALYRAKRDGKDRVEREQAVRNLS